MGVSLRSASPTLSLLHGLLVGASGYQHLCHRKPALSLLALHVSGRFITGPDLPPTSSPPPPALQGLLLDASGNQRIYRCDLCGVVTPSRRHYDYHLQVRGAVCVQLWC